MDRNANERIHRILVAVVLDPGFGQKLREIASRFDVWVVPSPEHRSIAEELWQQKIAGSFRRQLTVWSTPQNVDLEATWFSILHDVEMHHEQYSHDPPVTTLEVFGAEPTEVARKALAEFKYTFIKRTSGGFRAIRIVAV